MAPLLSQGITLRLITAEFPPTPISPIQNSPRNTVLLARQSTSGNRHRCLPGPNTPLTQTSLAVKLAARGHQAHGVGPLMRSVGCQARGITVLGRDQALIHWPATSYRSKIRHANTVLLVKTPIALPSLMPSRGPNMANFMADMLKVKSVAVLDDTGAYGVGLADAFQAWATSAASTVLGRDRVDPRGAATTGPILDQDQKPRSAPDLLRGPARSPA